MPQETPTPKNTYEMKDSAGKIVAKFTYEKDGKVLYIETYSGYDKALAAADSMTDISQELAAIGAEGVENFNLAKVIRVGGTVVTTAIGVVFDHKDEDEWQLGISNGVGAGVSFGSAALLSPILTPVGGVIVGGLLGSLWDEGIDFLFDNFKGTNTSFFTKFYIEASEHVVWGDDIRAEFEGEGESRRFEVRYTGNDPSFDVRTIPSVLLNQKFLLTFK